MSTSIFDKTYNQVILLPEIMSNFYYMNKPETSILLGDLCVAKNPESKFGGI